MKINNLFAAAAVELPRRVSIYVPGTVGTATEDESAAAAMVEHVAGLLSSWFGGASASPVSGYWVSDSAGLVREAVTVVYANTTAAQMEERGEDLLRLAQHVKSEMAQEAVSVEIDGSLFLV